MRVREYIQENRADIGTSGTKSYDLDYRDPITQMDLYFEGTNGATHNKENPFERCITKVELVDGGEVLWDLPGEVAFAAYATDNEGVPYGEREEAASASVRQMLPIRFGRSLFDTDYAFDPRKHRHPQLRFTFDEAAQQAAGVEGWESDTWTFTLHVRLMEGAPAPKGFLSYRTVQSFNSSAGGNRVIELPTDRTIRYLINRTYAAGVAMYSNITNHKLTADGGKWVGFDLAARDFMNRHCETFKPIWLNSYVSLSADTTKEHWVGINNLGSVTAYMPGEMAGGVFYIYSYLYARMVRYDNLPLDDRPAYLAVNGWAFHNTLMYAFGDRMKPEQWLDPKVFGKLDYVVTDAAATADVDIALQQVYRY